MVKFNFPSLFLILTTAATLVFASAPPLQSIKCVTTGLFISNVGGFGLNVTSNGNADNGLSFWESGSSLAIGGESGWFIAPALPMVCHLLSNCGSNILNLFSSQTALLTSYGS
ncbi:hypothetical protein AX14_005788 [Amanita brunnescens Koide BX004]|nr:hypothetical protein AX14_005788 [Amanita brunnescens Koide BX004]